MCRKTAEHGLVLFSFGPARGEDHFPELSKHKPWQLSERPPSETSDERHSDHLATTRPLDKERYPGNPGNHRKNKLGFFFAGGLTSLEMTGTAKISPPTARCQLTPTCFFLFSNSFTFSSSSATHVYCRTPLLVSCVRYMRRRTSASKPLVNHLSTVLLCNSVFVDVYSMKIGELREGCTQRAIKKSMQQPGEMG